MNLSFRGTLPEMYAKLEALKASKLDFVADLRTVTFAPDGANIRITPNPGDRQIGEFLPTEGLTVKRQAQQQLCELMDPVIPFRYFEPLSTRFPGVAANLLNLTRVAPNSKENNMRRLWRCLDGELRACLSSNFRILDHIDATFLSMEAIKESGGHVIECSLSDTLMRIKWTTPTHSIPDPDPRGGEGKFRPGGKLPGGFIIGRLYPYGELSNSETGHGGFAFKAGCLKPYCTNGAIIDTVFRHTHLGERLDTGLVRYSEETQTQAMKAIWLKARDSIRASFTPDFFTKLTTPVVESAADKITAPSAAVDGLVGDGIIPQESRDALLTYFLSDYSSTRYGLAQAVSRFAQDLDDVDASAALETAAGDLMTGRMRVAREPALVTA